MFYFFMHFYPRLLSSTIICEKQKWKCTASSFKSKRSQKIQIDFFFLNIQSYPEQENEVELQM